MPARLITFAISGTGHAAQYASQSPVIAVRFPSAPRRA